MLAVGETVSYTGHYSKNILLPRERCPHAPGCCLLTGTVTVSSERMYSFFQTSCLLLGSMVRPGEFMIMGPLLHFLAVKGLPGSEAVLCGIS